MRVRRRLRFSKQLWNQWLKHQQSRDSHYRSLAAGIALFRKSLAEKESRS